MISSGALNEAVAAAGLEPVPHSIILIAGAWLTGVLAAIYIYVFTAVL